MSGMLWARLRTMTLILGLCGCAESLEGTTTDDEVVLEHIEALGFERERAEVDGDVVRVDGDLIFNRAELLAGNYHRGDFEDAGLVEKGYRTRSGLISKANRRNIRLAFSTQQPPNQRIKDAFTEAAAAWSAIPGSSIRISPTNTGATVTVHMVSEFDWPRGTPCPVDGDEAEACAEAPLNGKVGARIWIKRRSTDHGCRDWAASGLVHMTRHELGHALGFVHPVVGDRGHVPDTGLCDKKTSRECVLDPGYSTVMGSARYTGSKCAASPARLTKDDYATCVAIYPE